MQTRNYTTYILPLVKALCGVEFALIELPRIKSFVNRRAKMAYQASSWWPRWLVVGEERTLSSGVIPYTQAGLDSIDTFLRIWKAAPYGTTSVQDFDFYVAAAGATPIDGNLGATSAFVTYKKQDTATYGDGGTETAAIPEEWAEYIAHGVCADFMRAEGQLEKSIAEEQMAMEHLQDELIKVDTQHGTQLLSKRIQTNANMQSRY